MEFTNFEFPDSVVPNYRSVIPLEAYGLSWDLHNWGIFRQLSFEPLSGDVVLEWIVSPDGSDGRPNLETACRFRFVGVTLLRMGKRDDAYPASESETVSDITIRTDGVTERLLFEFQDERDIEIAARTVTLERDL